MNFIGLDRKFHSGRVIRDQEVMEVVMTEIRVILAGVGRVGKDVARLLSARPNYGIVAAYTRNPNLSGQDLDTLAGIRSLGVTVTVSRELRSNSQQTYWWLQPPHSSRRSQLTCGCVELSAVSTSSPRREEAAFPWLVDEQLANELIDLLAKARQVSVLGVGLIPDSFSTRSC